MARLLGFDAPDVIECLGSSGIPERVPLGLICSVSCPGSVIVQTYDAVRALRDAGVVVAGGFHSPMEMECLDFLLRGPQAVLLFAATGVKHVVLRADARRALVEGRLCVLSRFDDVVERATAEQGSLRNDLVAAVSEGLFVPYAAPGGKAEATALRALTRGQTVLTLADEANSPLVRAGATEVSAAELSLPRTYESVTRNAWSDRAIDSPRPSVVTR